MEIEVRYVVKNENTLGYIFRGREHTMGVLAGNVTRGGHEPFNGPAPVTPSDKVRAATREDFDSYRVQAPLDLNS